MLAAVGAPALTITSFCCAFVNPAASTVIVYVPGFSAGRVYEPDSLVGVVYFRPVASSRIVTVALGTAAPDASVIVPVTVPRSRCANTILLRSNVATKTRPQAKRGIYPPRGESRKTG